jgi:hypothetical protein
MLNIFSSHHRSPKKSLLNESRFVHLKMPGLTGLNKLIKPAAVAAPQATAAAAPNVAAAAGPNAIKRFGKWLVTPTGLNLGTLARLPLMIPYYGGYYPFIKFPWYLTKKISGKSWEFIRTSSYYEPGKDALKTLGKVPVAGYHIGAGPPIEIGKSWFIRFPKYAIHDNIMTGLSGMWNIPAAAISGTAKTGWETLKAPFNTLVSPFKSAKNILWDAPREALAKNYRNSVKSVLSGIAKPFIAATKPFVAAGNAIRCTASEIGLTTTSYAVNAAKTFSIPFESVINSFRRQWKGIKMLKSVKDMFNLGHAEDFRNRFKAVLNRPVPFAHNFAS